jgi:hypothetical protein
MTEQPENGRHLVERTTPLPLSASQRGNWAAQKLFPGAAAFRVSQLIWLNGPVDTAAFVEAVGTAFAEADAMHVHFGDDDGVPFQTLGVPAPLQTHIDDEARDDEQIRALARAEVTANSSSEPTTKSRLLRRGDGGWAWSLLSNNLLLDGYSLSLYTRRIAELYSAAVTGSNAPDRWFGNLEDAVAAAAAGAPDHETLEYWRGVLAVDTEDDAQAQPDLTDVFSFSYRPVMIPASEDVYGRLRSFARGNGASWSDVLITLWGLFTSLAEGRDYLSVRVPLMLRDSRELLRTPLAISRALPIVVQTNPYSTRPSQRP